MCFRHWKGLDLILRWFSWRQKGIHDKGLWPGIVTPEGHHHTLRKSGRRMGWDGMNPHVRIAFEYTKIYINGITLYISVIHIVLLCTNSTHFCFENEIWLPVAPLVRYSCTIFIERFSWRVRVNFSFASDGFLLLKSTALQQSPTKYLRSFS